MKYKRLLCIVTAALLVFSLCSCGETDFTKKSVYYRTTATVRTLDPQLASTNAEFTAVENCFEGLMTLDENGKIACGAAESYDISADGLTYTFHLRQNMLWSDSETAVTAEDYEFGLIRALLPETKAPFASLLYSIKNAQSVVNGKKASSALGVNASDEQTLVITLSRPDRNLTRTLCAPVSMPCNRAFFESTNGRYGLDGSSVLCNGAYYLKNWNTEDNLLSLRRFNDYNGAAAVPYSAVIGFGREYEDIYNALQSEDINIGTLTGDFTARLGDTVYRETFYNTSCVLLISPTVSENMRRALTLDINIDALKLNLPEYYSTDVSIVPVSAVEGEELYRQKAGELKLHEYDPAAAKKYIKSQRNSKGSDGIDYSEYTLYYPSGDADIKQFAGLIVQQWQNELNAPINAAAFEGEDYISMLKSGEIKAAIVPIQSVTGTASNAADGLYTLGIDGFNSKLPQSGDDIDKSCTAIKNAEQYLIDNYYALPLFNVPQFCCMTRNISKAVFSASGSYMLFRYIEKSDD